MASVEHMTLGDLREMVARYAYMPNTIQVRLFLDRAITVGGVIDGSASTYTVVTTPLSFYAADDESPDSLAIGMADTGMTNGE
jgi:hypothetical protein